MGIDGPRESVAPHLRTGAPVERLTRPITSGTARLQVMRPMWATGVIVVVALLAALLLALIARAPAEVRRATVPSSATDPARGARFTDEEVARHGAFREGAYAYYGLGLIVEVIALVLLARGMIGRGLEWLERVPGGWPVRAALLGILVSILLGLAALPLNYVFGYLVQHAWGLSNQGAGDWTMDRVRGAGVAAIFAAVMALAFFGVVRWQPRTWWLWGWAIFTVLTAVVAFLWPVVIAPLFNKFTPLPDGSLRTRVLELASEAGVGVGEVYVIDASRRSSIENAYVAGLGSTKQMVLYDTLITGKDEDETAFIVAHELGHQVENHVFKNVLLASTGLFVGFAVLGWLAGRPGFLSWAGATGPGDLRALPVLLLFALVANLVALPAQNFVSRRLEARADEIAMELTGDPLTATRVFRRLAYANIADLRPPEIAVAMLFTHPPIPQRIDSLMAEARRAP